MDLRTKMLMYGQAIMIIYLRLTKAQVRVFEQTSRGENMILTLENQVKMLV